MLLIYIIGVITMITASCSLVYAICRLIEQYYNPNINNIEKWSYFFTISLLFILWVAIWYIKP